MATYRVSVSNHEYVVDVSGDQVMVDGQPVQASLTPLNNGGLVLLRQENKARELHIMPQGNSIYAVMVNGRHLIAQVEKNCDKPKKRQEQVNQGAINAPMPGMVVDVLVEEGQQVENGEPLIVLESMKMQMQLRAPFSGQVCKVAVGKKDQVEKGMLLVQVVAV